MAQILHGSATTTEAVRRAIQHSQESLRRLAKRYGVNPKTVAKWKARTSVSDLPTGPREPRSTVLSAEEEAVVVAFRRHSLLPLDDCLYALQPTIPHLTRSSLHRCLQRNGISRPPQVEGEASAKRKFKPLSDRLFSYRPRRGSNCARQALPARRHRPNVEVRLRRAAREGGAPHRGGLPAPLDRRRPLQGPYRPHRQRNPLHHARQYELGGPRHQGRPGGWRARLGARLLYDLEYFKLLTIWKLQKKLRDLSS
jgi:transposase